MELRPGNKQTEVRVIPEEWDVQCLSSLVTKGPKNGYSGRSSKDARGTPTLSLGATTSGTLLLNDETVKHLEETINGQSDLFLQSGDVLVQRSNTIDLVGTTAIFNGPSGVYVYPDLMMRLRFREEATAHWFWRFANSAHGRRFFMSVAAGSSGSMPKISGNKLRQMQLPVPPLTERREVATALSDADALLGGLVRLIAKKRDLKQAAMQQLLTGQTRLPGFHEEWEAKRLGEIFEITSSKRVFQSEWRSAGIPFYRARELAVLGETGRVENELFITRELYETHRRAYGVPAVGDMLVTGVGTLGKVYVVSDDREFYFKDGNIIWFQISGKMSSKFLCQLYLTPGVLKQIAEGAAGTTVGTYTITAAKRTLIPFPPLPEQFAIAAVLSDMDAELAALEARRDKTRALKQAMMQELLTGKTRLLSPQGASS